MWTTSAMSVILMQWNSTFLVGSLSVLSSYCVYKCHRWCVCCRQVRTYLSRSAWMRLRIFIEFQYHRVYHILQSYTALLLKCMSRRADNGSTGHGPWVKNGSTNVNGSPGSRTSQYLKTLDPWLKNCSPWHAVYTTYTRLPEFQTAENRRQ